MIDSKQLMQGNWVLHNGIPHKVVYISDEQCSFNKEDYFFWDEVDPISLYPDILEKAGFVFHKHAAAKQSAFDGYRQLVFDEIDGICIQTVLSGFKWPIPKIQYLHQLQNLFYAFTQTELNIKL